MMGKVKQLWRCPECNFDTNYRGSCKECSDTKADVWVQRERINADGSPYEKKLVSSTKGNRSRSNASSIQGKSF